MEIFDGQQSNLSRLGLSVASVLRLAPQLQRITRATDDSALFDRAKGMLSRVDQFMSPGLEAAVSEEFMSSHWIATFGWEALILGNAAHGAADYVSSSH